MLDYGWKRKDTKRSGGGYRKAVAWLHIFLQRTTQGIYIGSSILTLPSFYLQCKYILAC